MIGESSLPTILIQHLFTTFVWAISEDLCTLCLPLSFGDSPSQVKIDGRDRFQTDNFHETWYLPRLSHAKLTALVEEIKGYGMGSEDDILLCIIPAFSSKDLLPNRVMVQLLPPLKGDTGWAATARCYRDLLDTKLRKQKPEKLSYCVVAYVMDFVYFAHQPYDEVFKPEEELNRVLKDIVINLNSPSFSQVVRMLAPVHSHQGRRETFGRIFKQYARPKSASFKMYEDDEEHMRMSLEYPKIVLGCSRYHEDTFYAEFDIETLSRGSPNSLTIVSGG